MLLLNLNNCCYDLRREMNENKNTMHGFFYCVWLQIYNSNAYRLTAFVCVCVVGLNKSQAHENQTQ